VAAEEVGVLIRDGRRRCRWRRERTFLFLTFDMAILIKLTDWLLAY